MNPNTKLVLGMGAALALGMGAGAVVNIWESGERDAAGDAVRAGAGANSGPEGGVLKPDAAGSGKNAAGAFPGAGAGERFEELGVERQREIFEKIAQRLAKESSPGIQLGITRLVNSLSVAQVSALLEALPREQFKGGGGQGPGFVRWALAQKLASEDAGLSLDLGKKLKDEVLMGSAVAVMARKSGADALRAVAGLPEEERARVLAAMDGAGIEKVGGSVKEILEVFRENKSLAAGALNGMSGRGGGWQLSRLMGAALAGTALQSPSDALEQYAELSAFMEEMAPGDEGRSGRGGRGGGRRGGGGPPGSPASWILQSTLSMMRVSSPESASALFDSLGENVRSPWMFTDEAISRFRRSGVDSAVGFAEAQSDPEALRSAALGTWWILAQRDREGALQWIESLPQGAFRQGVLTAVMVDAWNESRTWGSSQAAIEAGAKLASRASQLDYYASLMADRPERSYSQRGTKTELINQLPVSEAEKEELYRRVAPIKPQE